MLTAVYQLSNSIQKFFPSAGDQASTVLFVVVVLGGDEFLRQSFSVWQNQGPKLLERCKPFILRLLNCFLQWPQFQIPGNTRIPNFSHCS